MSYLALLLTGLLPPIVLLLARGRHHDVAPSVPLRGQAGALTVLVALAVVSTLPWDAALIARGTWSYPQAHLVGHVAGVPVEELLFMVLQPVLVAGWLRGLPAARDVEATVAGPARARAAGSAAWLCAALAGVLLAGSPHGSYLGWLLAWAAPLLAVQWAVGGDRLWARRRLLLLGVTAPVLYLCALDRLALSLRLWQLSAGRTTGATVLGLPVEEGLFFVLTTLLVVGGLLLATDPVVRHRLRHRLPADDEPVAHAPGRQAATRLPPSAATLRRGPRRHPLGRPRRSAGRTADRPATVRR